MKHKLQILPLVAVLLVVAPVMSASGQTMQDQSAPEQRPQGPPSGPFGGDPIHQLNLTPEQREQIRVIRQQNQEERATINRRVRETNRALQETLDSDNPDEAALHQRVREASAAQADAMRMRILSEVKIRRVLTPDQRILLRSLRRQVNAGKDAQRVNALEEREKRRDERSLRIRERRKNSGHLFPGRVRQSRPTP